MAVSFKPEGYQTAIPYLIVDDAAGEIEFLKRAFGAVEGHVSRTPDGTVMHADVTIGDSHVMMGQAAPQWPAVPGMVYLYLEDTDAAYRRAVDAGATSLMEPADQFYGDRNAGVKDANGVTWWISTHIEDVPPDELERRAQKAMAERAKASGGG